MFGVTIDYIGPYRVSWDPQTGEVWVGDEYITDEYGTVNSESEAMEIAHDYVSRFAY